MRLVLLLALLVGMFTVSAEARPATATPPTHSATLDDPRMRAEIEALFAELHKPDIRKLVVFADGVIYSVRAPRLGKSVGVVNLWHCYDYRPIGEWNVHLLLGARVIGELEHDDYPVYAARHDVQCMQEKAQEKLVERAIAAGTAFILILAAL